MRKKLWQKIACSQILEPSNFAIRRTSQGLERSFPGGGDARCFGTGTMRGVRGGSRRLGSFVSPWRRIGRLCRRLVESESRVQDARRTSRPTGKSL